MNPGYTNQSAEWDREILRSSDFQLISITLDSTSVYDPSNASPSTRLPKGLLVTLSTDLADGVYEPLSTAAGELGTKQGMEDVVVLAETIVDASLADQPVKAYLAGTFDYDKLKWNNMDNDGLTQAEQELILGRIKIVDTVFA
jgi:hypothetical protein